MRSLIAIAALLAGASIASAAAAKDDSAQKPAAPGERVIIMENGRVSLIPKRFVDGERPALAKRIDSRRAREHPGHRIAVHNGRVTLIPKAHPEALATAD